MDLCALCPDGSVWGVEVKSCRADFLADDKWQDYRAWCDRLYFAVPAGFPEGLLPGDAGLIRADAHGGEILRTGEEHRLSPARRRAITQRLARLATERLTRHEDPGAALL